MENIIVFVDEAEHALHELMPMLSSQSPTNWVLVGCPPRMSRHISRWVSNRSRHIWREKWGQNLLAELSPSLMRTGDTVQMRLAEKDLIAQTRQLKLEFGAGRVLDARRPKMGQSLAPVTPDQPAQQNASLATVGSTSVLGAILILTAD